MDPVFNNRFDAVDPQEFAAFLASYGPLRVLLERDALAHPVQAETLLAAAGWQRASRIGRVDVYVQAAPSPPAAILARAREHYFRTKRLATLARRERLNVCAIRRIEAVLGLHPAFVWSLYRHHAQLPLPIESIDCKTK